MSKPTGKLASACETLADIGSRIEALLAERDAAQKDAERYRWLRSAKDWPYLGMTPDSCDAAIDQAMQREQP